MKFKNWKKVGFVILSIITAISVFTLQSCKDNPKVDSENDVISEQKNLNEIVSEEDIESLFLLKDNSDFSIVLHQILVNRHEKNPDSLNQIQWNLFLCMHLENAGQSETILTFLEEWFPDQREQVIISLTEIGAVKSAESIKLAVTLLPKDGSSFFDNPTENSDRFMMTLNSLFINYPDGPMPDLYRKYAEKHRDEI
jgi:hypothetical protein